MQRRESEVDGILLAKIAGGDHHAFRVLFDLYHGKVYSYAYRFLRSEAPSEEIVQEVFIKIWLRRAELDSIANFGGYLRVVAKNLTLNALKKIALDFKIKEAGHLGWTEVDNDTESGILLKDTKALLNQAIDRLPGQQKIVYRLFHLEGLKQKEVAAQLNISPLTVKVHLREAAKAIRIFMAERTEISVLIFLFFRFLK
jgi:RNA polymerase sigma-70 factor (family 1)